MIMKKKIKKNYRYGFASIGFLLLPWILMSLIMALELFREYDFRTVSVFVSWPPTIISLVSSILGIAGFKNWTSIKDWSCLLVFVLATIQLLFFIFLPLIGESLL